MVWRLRASLQDRPGALVKLTTACGDAGVNILALDVLPASEGQVIDELVLHTPGWWTERDLRSMCHRADVTDAEVSRSLREPAETAPRPHVTPERPSLVREGGRRGQPAMGTITAPLATLLQRRQELRDAVAAADLIDSAIREGA